MSSNTNLGNTPVSQGYTQLFHTGETGGLTSTLQQVFDGDGTGSDLYLATNKVKIGTAGNFLIGSSTIQEFIQDIVGDMFDTNGSHTNITATYDDNGDGAIDLVSTGEVTLTGTQTLTNKTLASPTFTGDIDFTDANTPRFSVTDDTGTNSPTTTILQSANGLGSIGTTTSNHFEIISHNQARMKFTPNRAEFNTNSADYDFLVFDDGFNALIFGDAGNSRVGILDSTPSYTLDVNGTGRFTGALQLDSTLTFDSVALSAVQTSGESFADNDTSLMTSASINDKIGVEIANLVDSAPGTLDTLNELASALGDDPNFATTTATNIGTKLAKASNLSDLTNAGTARTNLGVDPAGTDNSTNVTLAGSLNYLTLSGQEITRNAIDLSTDITGTLPVGNGGTGATTLASNAILTGNGTSAIQAESSLTFDGSALNLLTTTANRRIEIGLGATQDVTSFVDLIGDTTYSDYGGRFIRYGGANAITQIMHRGTGSLRLLTQDSAPIDFLTASAVRARISSSGNMVIGSDTAYTTGGTPKLSLVGGGLNLGANANDLSYIRRIDTGDYQWQTWNGNNDGQIHLQPYGGKVGIGLTNPSYLLHLSGTAPELAFTDTDGSATWRTRAVTNNFHITETGAGDPFVIESGAGANALKINSSGNIGIGLTSPGSKLHVQNGATSYTWTPYAGTTAILEGTSSGHSILSLVTSTTGNSSVWFGDTDHQSIGRIRYEHANNKMEFWTTNVERMAISSAGAITFNNAYTFPTSDGSSGQFLKTNGSGNVLFSDGDIDYTDLGSGSLGLNDNNKTLIFSSSSASWGVDFPASTLFTANTNVDNRILTATGATNGVAINGEANLTFDASDKTLLLDGTGASAELATFKWYQNEVQVAGAGTGNAQNITLNATHGTTLNTLYRYKITLTTRGTGTDTGAVYIVSYDQPNTTWIARMVSRGGSTSNHPLLHISGSNAQAYHNHASNYYIAYSVQSKYVREDDGTFHNFGADYHWQRDVDTLSYSDGDVNIDSNTLFVDASTDRVGIGVSNPSRKLQVAGAIELSADDNTIDTNNFALRRNSGGAGHLDVPGSLRINLDANNNETTAHFEVCHDAGSTPVFKVQENGDTTGKRFAFEDTNAIIYRNSNDLELITYAGYDINLMPSGNVGIGGDTPQSKLMVVTSAESSIPGAGADSAFFTIGNVASGTAQYGTMMGTLGSGNGYIQQQRFDGNATTYNLLLQPNGGSVGIGTSSPGALLDVGGRIKLTSSGVLQWGSSANYGNLTWDGDSAIVQGQSGKDLDLRSGSSRNILFKIGSAEKARINSSGNVGIGTNSPDGKLNIDVNTSASAGQNDDASNYSFVLNCTSGSSTGHIERHIGFRDPGGDVVSAINAVDDGGSGATGITFATGNVTTLSEAMRIDSSGNVGIGTSSPGQKLHIGSRGTASDPTIASEDGLQFDFYNAGNPYQRKASIISNSADTSEAILAFWTTASSASATQKMTILGNGNVGIGTNSPSSYKLQFGNAGDKIGVDLSSGGTTRIAEIEFYNGSDGSMKYKTQNSSSGGHEFYTQGTKRMEVERGGAVKLPNDNQYLKFGVGGDGVIYSLNDDFYISNFTAGQDTIFQNLNSAGSSYVTNLFIDGSAQRVGIGTTSPAQKLHTNGTSGDTRTRTSTSNHGTYFESGVTSDSAGILLVAGHASSILNIYLQGSGGTQNQFRFTHNGDFLADEDIVAYSTSVGSDRKLKNNIKDISYGLSDVMKMRAVEFDWKEKRDKAHDIGVIAQEIEEIIPEVVKEVETLNTDGETHKVVDYAKLSSVLIKAIQEQQQQINELKEKLNG